MMMKKNRICILLFLFPIVVSNAQPVEWKNDIEFLRKELPKKHINFFAAKEKEDFEKGLDDILNLADSLKLSNLSVAIKLQQLIADFGDSHTSVYWARHTDTRKILPIQTYWFKDGIYVLGTSRPNLEIVGKKIVACNGFPLEKIIDSLSTLLTIDNQAIVKDNIPSLLTYGELYAHFGFSTGVPMLFTFVSVKGDTIIREVKYELITKKDKVFLKPELLAFRWQNKDEYFAEKYFESDAIYYIQYNSCWSMELEKKQGDKKKAKSLPSYEEFEKTVVARIDTLTFEKLIVDLGFNKGGNSSQASKMIVKLLENDQINQPNRLYVIIGRATFSSAILNTMEFKNNSQAILVGEETGGKPNHYGEIKSVKLPETGIEIIYSTKFFKLTDAEVNTIKPDFTIETSFQEYVKGIDPVYDWIRDN